MSRKRLTIRPVRKKLSLPGDLVAAIEEQFFSSARGKPSYGAFSSLVAFLLRQWLATGCALPDGFDPNELTDELSEPIEPQVPTLP